MTTAPESRNDQRVIWRAEDLVFRVGCPLCAVAGGAEVAARKDGLAIRHCRGCLAGFVDPIPREDVIARYYDLGYFTGEKTFFRGVNYFDARDQALRSGEVTGYREIVDFLLLKGKRILEIGCASGALLKALEHHEPRSLVGIDLSEEALAWGRQRYGLDLRAARLEDAELEPGSFDLVVLVDVLEHVYRPIEFIERVADVLAPGGWVFISTPNFASLAATGNSWLPLSSDFEHLQYLSRESLELLGRRSGLELRRCWSESLPVQLRQYRPVDGKSRLLRVLSEPGVLLHNIYAKMRFGRPFQREGLQLMAFLEKAGNESD